MVMVNVKDCHKLMGTVERSVGVVTEQASEPFEGEAFVGRKAVEHFLARVGVGVGRALLPRATSLSARAAKSR